MRHTINAMDFIEMLRSRKDPTVNSTGFFGGAPADSGLRQSSVRFDDCTEKLLGSFRSCTEKKASEDYKDV